MIMQLRDSCRTDIGINNRRLTPCRMAIGEGHMCRSNGKTYGYGIRPIRPRQEPNGLLKMQLDIPRSKPYNWCKIPSSSQDKVMITKQSLIAACEQHHSSLESEMLIIEVFMRNIVATLIYSDNSYTNVFDYHEGLCRTIQ